MAQFKKYHESIRVPIYLRLSLSLFIGFVFWGGLTWMTYPGLNRLPALFPSLIFVIAVGTLAFLLLSMFYKISIRISKKMVASTAEKEILLRISGVQTEGGSYIRCENIQTLDIRPYNVSGFASIIPFYPRTEDEGVQMILLPGYKWDGIQLSYTYETVFLHKEKTHTIFFPTKDAPYLLGILKGIIE